MREGPIVLITGGASGIGRTIAESFLELGHRVHVCDSDPAAVASCRDEIPEITATTADISDVDDVAVLFDDLVGHYNGLDILVNNAGIAGPTAAVEDIDPADWQRTIAVDLNGQFYCTRLAVPLLKSAGGGSIVNIASNAAFFGFPLRLPYTACKWALIGFTKTLAMELGPHAIRVNAVCPGSVAGPRIDGVIERDAAARGCPAGDIASLYRRQSSLRTFVEARDVANLVTFLTSEHGARISGQALGVDGHTENLSSGFD
ncbi:MAG: SDR family oxidoreductase [Woeseiaceae bacterium]|nr:SDR family oxidoreductase [Woeseiaceae bacterium]